MPRLVSLPDKNGAPGSARMWFNPDQVVYAVPRLVSDGAGHVLTVDLKLTGLPLIDAWLGSFPSREDADHAWQKFLNEIAGNS